MTYSFGHLIGGAWRDTPATFGTFNPARRAQMVAAREEIVGPVISTVPDSHMPFGGIKASGVDAYAVGPSAAAFYTTEHAVYLGA
jgi:hypothetical protein